MAKKTDSEKVQEYMDQLDHPLKAEIETVREIIKGADDRILERVKWNAPSYYFKEDMVTFHTKALQHVHLVFHHPDIVKIPSPLLSGDYKDRRMAYFRDMAEVTSGREELQRIVRELVAFQE